MNIKKPSYLFIQKTPGQKYNGFEGSSIVYELPSVKKDKRYCGYISYDLKNRFENLSSNNFDGCKFPEAGFFEVKNKISSTEIKDLFNSNSKSKTSIAIKQRVSKTEYIRTVKKIKAHIQRGDIYELNYCIEFFAEKAVIDPFQVFERLTKISKAPFASIMQLNELFIVSSSPERFLKRTGSKLISQPIKGTAPRGKTKAADEKLKSALKSSKKERTENVMIVDLVRNDLSRIAKEGTVKVDELFGIYSFEQVHQMISTVSCELKNKINFSDIIKATFPMGSMTGAPKVKAMELIEEFERTKRGVYSGALGMIEQNGNFDLSVVIRTILYNSKKKYLSFMVGSAITAASDPEQEYEECLLKAKGMLMALGR